MAKAGDVAHGDKKEVARAGADAGRSCSLLVRVYLPRRKHAVPANQNPLGGWTPGRSATRGLLRQIQATVKFNVLWNNYPLGTSNEVKKLIGGKVDAGWYDNTCAVRMSRSLNYSGHPIPHNHILKLSEDADVLDTISGADKKWYAYRVKQLKMYIAEIFGSPSSVVFASPQANGVSKDSFWGKKGIVAFDVTGWTDATGHLDLWDGSAPRYSEYFDKARSVSFWEMV